MVVRLARACKQSSRAVVYFIVLSSPSKAARLEAKETSN